MRALSDSSFAVILVIAKWKRAIINLCTQEFSLEMKLKAPSTTKPLYLVLYTLIPCVFSVLQLVYKIIPLSTADEKLFDVLSPMRFLSLKAKYVGITVDNLVNSQWQSQLEQRSCCEKTIKWKAQILQQFVKK